MTTPRKFYIAGRFGRRAELQEIADGIERTHGWKSTARWLTGAHNDLGPNDNVEVMARVALEDLADILASDVVFAFTEPPGTPGAKRGGRHFELGYAFAIRKPVTVIGPVENVFCALCQRVDTVDEAVRRSSRC